MLKDMTGKYTLLVQEQDFNYVESYSDCYYGRALQQPCCREFFLATFTLWAAASDRGIKDSYRGILFHLYASLNYFLILFLGHRKN